MKRMSDKKQRAIYNNWLIYRLRGCKSVFSERTLSRLSPESVERATIIINQLDSIIYDINKGLPKGGNLTSIKSYWQKETAHFDGEKFINRKKSDIEEKELKVIILGDKPNQVIKFLGGPTGFEIYYLNDLIENLFGKSKDDIFCICGGTINSWPRCWIKLKDLKEILGELNV